MWFGYKKAGQDKDNSANSCQKVIGEERNYTERASLKKKTMGWGVKAFWKVNSTAWHANSNAEKDVTKQIGETFFAYWTHRNIPNIWLFPMLIK